MCGHSNWLECWIIIFVIIGLPSASLQFISPNSEIKRSRSTILFDTNTSLGNWIPLQRTLRWKSDEFKLPVSTLSSTLLRFADSELGLTTTTNSFESMSSGSKTSRNAEEEIDGLALKFSGQLKSYQDALERMADVIISSAEVPATSLYELPLCCQLPAESFQFDEHFDTPISKTSACWTLPYKVKHNAFIPGPFFSRASADNSAKLSHLKWQYFISPEGIHVEYPANNRNCKNTTVARQPPHNPKKGHSERKLWLIQKAKQDTRIHRLVFLIQLGPDTTPVIVKAVRTIVMLLLRFLDNTDEVGIVSSEPDHLSSNFVCDQMVPLTPWTRYQILNFLNYIERLFKWPSKSQNSTITTDSEMDQTSLLQKAVHMACANFTDTPRFPPSASTIIHLSSYANNANIINNHILVNCPIFIESFFLNLQKFPNEEEDYKNILQNVPSKNIWRVQVFYMHKMEPESFAVKVALKLNSKKEWWSLSDILSQFFPQENSTSAQLYDFSFPHWSSTFPETVIVAKKYIFHHGQPLGLVAIEINLLDFLQHFTYFTSDNVCDSSSYAFLIDKYGRVIAHPALGKPDRSKEMPQIQIDQIEVEIGFTSVKRKMVSEERGCQSLQLRNGKSWITYAWIGIEQGYVAVLAFLEKFSGCASEKNSFTLRKGSLDPKSGVQHHLLLQKNVCCQNQMISVRNAALYLAPNSFLRPAEILSDRSLLRIKPKLPLALMAFIGDNSGLLLNQNRGMRTEIKDHISALANSVPTWMKQFINSEWSKYILRRFASGAGGTFLLIYPGLTITSGYVPRSSSWFRKAAEEHQKLIFLPPTIDAQSKIAYTTMSQSVNIAVDVPFSSEKQVTSIAVMGADINTVFFERILEDLMPECRNRVIHHSTNGRNVSVSVRCFLVDSEGYVIYHPHLIKHLKLSPRTHITQLEPLSVIDVLQHGQDSPAIIPMKKRLCQKLSESSSAQNILRRVYSIDMSSEGIQNLNAKDLCIQYQMVPVPETNLFLSVVQDGCISSTAFCPCSTVDKLCLNCLRIEPTECECPCECPREPNFCTRKSFEEIPEDINLCEFPSEPLPMVSKNDRNCDNDAENNENLFNITCDGVRHSCSSILRMDDCLGAWDCDWCRAKGSRLTEANCIRFTQCYGYDSDGEINTAYNRANESNSKEMLGATDGEDGTQITVVPIVGVLSMFLIFIGLVFYCYRHRALSTGRSQPDLHLLPLQESSMGCVIPQSSSARSDRNTDHECMAQQVAIEGRVNHSVQGYVFPPRSPLGSVFGTDSDHGYSTMTPNEDSEYGGVNAVYADNPLTKLLDKLPMQYQNSHKGLTSRPGLTT